MNGIVVFITTIGIAVLISCLCQTLLVAFHLTAAMAPYDIGVNVKPPAPTPQDGATRSDTAIPEIRYVDDKDRAPTGYTVKVKNALETQDRSEFPMGM